MARIDDDRDLSVNINARYAVESVDIAGVTPTDVSQATRDALQALVGEPLDHDEAERLEDRIEVVERMAILAAGNRITSEAVPLEIPTPQPCVPSGLGVARDAAERNRIRQALDQTKGNVSRAARLLGIERTHLHKRIRSLGLSRGK